jgi:hypothetical protein
VILHTPSGAQWYVQEGSKKLALRARLPGARLFDLAAKSLRVAKEASVTMEDRFVLALPASWLVNSPAISRVLRRWALPPDREVWLALLELLERGEIEFLKDATEELVGRLGAEPYVIEAISKVAALLVPEVVPLMPAPAQAFVLGNGVPADAAAFVKIVGWFVRETRAHAAELDAIARSHQDVALLGSQALDRILWFDSDGHRHFPNEGLCPVTSTKSPGDGILPPVHSA